MQERHVRLFFIANLMVLLGSTFAVAAQANRPSLEARGEIVDQRGGVIVGAKVTLNTERQPARKATSNARGQFHFADLEPGNYTLKISAPGFAALEETLQLTAGSQMRRFTLFPLIEDSVSVADPAAAVSLDPGRAAGAQTIDIEQLKALPDDPDQLLDLLQLLSTTSGGAPGQATLTVDGFTHDGRLPPKSAIREVRINSNIFSAEYDKPPYRGGRIDVYTKPGASAFHGSTFFNFNDAALNARETFAPTRAPVTTRRYGGQIGGPIVRKRSGFFLDFETRDIDETTTVNAVILNRSFEPAAFTANAATPKLLTIGSARTDWQLNPAQTFIARYDFNLDQADNQGVGGFDLPARAAHSRAVNHSLRFSETAVIGRSIFNEARVGITFQRLTQSAASSAPAIIVAGAFSDGGASAQTLAQNEWRAEIIDHLSIAAGRHSLKFGLQFNGRWTSETRAENFNGTFIFGGGLAPQLNADRTTAPINISGLEQYRRTLLGLPGGTPTRFTINRGNPLIEGQQWIFSGFAQDEWQVGQNALVSLGLRYEGQTNPADRLSLGPRVGIGYSPDRKRHWVLRARAGLFYDRIAQAIALETLRLDGQRQEQIIIDSPSFPDPFYNGMGVASIPVVRRLDASLRPSVSGQTQFGFERQLPRGWKIELSHYWSRGWALLRSRNINAPMLTGNSEPTLAPRPFGVNQNILQFEASGKLSGQVLFVGVNKSGGKRLSIYSGYLRFDFHTDADQPFLMPQSSYDLKSEWARPSWQARHRAFAVVLLDLPWRVRASSEINLAAGLPYNITTGRDNNGDGNFNDRPGIAATSSGRAIETPFGPLDPGAINGALGRNLGANPFNATVDLNTSRTFNLGGKAAGADGYQMTLNVRASNLLNRANLSGVDGVLASPFFGRPNRAAPARRIEIGVRFNF